MLELKNEQNELSLKLTSLGYAREDGWIDVKIAVSQGEHTFSEESECLVDYDILTITNWFKSLSKRKLPEASSIYFLEREISFHFLESTRRWIQIAIELKASFELDFMPIQFHPRIFKKYTFDELIKGGWFDPHRYKQKMIFNLTRKNFLSIIASLEAASAELDR